MSERSGLRFLRYAMPTPVATQLASAIVAIRAASANADWDAAVSMATVAYEDLVAAQPPNGRYHKGEILLYLAGGLLRLGKLGESERAHLMAFAEDALSRGEESPDAVDEVSRPAAQNLVFLFDASGKVLLDFALRVRAKQATGRLYRRPEEALELLEVDRRGFTGDAIPSVPLEVFGLPEDARQASIASTGPSVIVPRWRVVGLFGTAFRSRVFVGGSYHDRDAVLAIRDELRIHGLDAVVALEFLPESNVPDPDQRLYEDAMALLRGCTRAVFDLSESRGQLQEFESVDHYRILDVLAVFKRGSRLSSMTKGKCASIGIVPVPYGGTTELRAIVAAWLL